MPDLPTGTITFLFTDIEESTKRWEAYAQAMQVAFARQEAILRDAIAGNGGYAYKMIGDAFQAAFPTAPEALQAALDAQRALLKETWPQEIGDLRVRMALHTGITEERGDDYVGPTLNRVARLLSAGHGGQVLLSQVAYDLVRDALPEGVTLRDLGEHRLKDLQRPEHVYQVVAPDLPIDFPPLATLDSHPNNLPIQRSSLIGREKVLAEVRDLLLRDDVGVLTLTGPGGTGKTRLALQVAADLVDTMRDGVFFVSLDPVHDPALVASAIAQALGLRESPGKPLIETLKEYLRSRQMLLVLDNFEQLVGAAPIVSDLLASAPHLKVLVTSREVLHLYGERDYPVPPLAVPDVKHLPPLERLSQYEAVRLFIERAMSVKPDFQVTNDNAPAVAEICSRLDGLPLAIELAAARISLMTPQTMLARLQSRLRLLTGGARNLPARQQTLRNTITWSYDLLDEDEKVLFRRLSVFNGGCTLDAIEEVCGPGVGLNGTHSEPQNWGPGVGSGAEEPLAPLAIDVLDGVASLVGKSLLAQDEKNGQERFRMLETVREYGLERLAESGEEYVMRRSHARFFTGLVEKAHQYIRSNKEHEWLDRIEDDLDNTRSALAWSLGHDIDLAVRLNASILSFWLTRGGLREGIGWTGRAVALPGASQHPAYGRLLTSWGYVRLFAGEFEGVKPRLELGVSLLRQGGDREALGVGLAALALANVRTGDLEGSRAASEESAAVFRELGIDWGLAQSLMSLAQIAAIVGDYAKAHSLLEEVLALYSKIDNENGLAMARNALGDTARLEGDYARAEVEYNATLELYRKSGATWQVPAIYHNLGHVALGQGENGRAEELFKESLDGSLKLEDPGGVAESLTGFAGVAAARHQGKRAARLLSASEALRKAVGADLWPAEKASYESILAGIHSQLDEGAFNDAWAKGQAMSQEQAVQLALEEVSDA